MSQVSTRSQQDMALAYELVSEAAVQFRENEKARTVYGGLCHNFPVLVLGCGLCQALAFVEDKAEGGTPQAAAHKLVLAHAARLLGAADRGALMTRVRTGDVSGYMLDTRRVLSAWVYWKRFAVSVLNVEAREAERMDEHA
jgi:CRISPR-associated protein Cmr5